MDRMQRFRIAYFIVVWAIVVALIVQVSLIGLWLFSGQPTLGIHMEFGHAITLMVVGLLILAFTGRLPRSMRLRTVLLAGLKHFAPVDGIVTDKIVLQGLRVFGGSG